MRIGPNPTRGCVDDVSFHALLLSETEFWQHLPAVLQIHILPKKSAYPENNKEVMPKLCLGPEQTMETNTSTHPHAVKKRGQSETDTVIDMQRSAYLQPYLFRTGDA